MTIKWRGSLGCDAANISVIDTTFVGAIRSGFSGHHTVMLPHDGEYEVTLTVKDTWNGGDEVVTQKMMSESGMFYVGDWCYTDLEDPSEELGNRILTANTGGDGEFEVTVEVQPV